MLLSSVAEYICFMNRTIQHSHLRNNHTSTHSAFQTSTSTPTTHQRNTRRPTCSFIDTLRFRDIHNLAPNTVCNIFRQTHSR